MTYNDRFDLYSLMKTSDFSYHLPDALIARYPSADRTASRLIVLSPDEAIEHRHFSDIGDYLQAGDLLVMNNTRVMSARLFACKTSGGKAEILIERLLGEHQALAHIRASRSPKPGSELLLFADESHTQGSSYTATMVERQGSLFLLEFSAPVLEVLDAIGHMPLPPYMERADEDTDKERYQTVYASQMGAVAAPTAGLHFDQALLQSLREKGVETAEVTLHVGAGTFQPVKVEDIEKHHMHSEWINVSESVCQQIAACKARGGRVVAVGTTAVRALESASLSGQLQPFSGETDIFLYPGKAFHCVDMLITNFHLPQSTLLMLVSAFAGTDAIRNVYKVAVEKNYRFFSYGDAMLLYRQTESIKTK